MISSTEAPEIVLPTFGQPVSGRSAFVVGVWGSAGSRKTTVACNLAFELAELGTSVLLVDADGRRPSIAALMNLVESGPGITAVTRLGRQGRLDESELRRLCTEIRFENHTLDVLTGLNIPNRWPELDKPGLEALLKVAGEVHDFVIVDLNDELESGLISSRAEGERNLATNFFTETADVVLGVFAADPVGINRFLFEARDVGFDYWPIANRVTPTTIGKHPERQIRESMAKLGRITPRAMLPDDPVSTHWSLLHGKPLRFMSKSSKLAAALKLLALDLFDSRAATLNSGM